MAIETGARMTSPKVMAAHLERYRDQLGFDGIIVLDRDGVIVGEARLDEPAVGFIPREVIRQGLRIGGVGIVLFSVVSSPQEWAKTVRDQILRVRTSGDAIGMELIDYLVVDHEGKESTLSFRLREGWRPRG